MKIKLPEGVTREKLQGVSKEITLSVNLFAVLPPPGAIMEQGKWIAEVERQLREGLESAIKNLKERGWPQK